MVTPGLDFRGMCSKRHQDVIHLLAVTGLLNIGDLSTPAIGDPRFRNLRVFDRVPIADVFGPDDSGDKQFSHLEIDPHLLAAANDQIAVGENLCDHCGHGQGDGFFPIDLSSTGTGAIAAQARQIAGIDGVWQNVAQAGFDTQKFGDIGVF